MVAKRVIEQVPTQQIAAELGVSRKTAWQEIQHPETQALIQTWMKPHHHRLEKIIDRSISQVERALTVDDTERAARIEALTDRITRLRQVISERAEDPQMQIVAGGGTVGATSIFIPAALVPGIAAVTSFAKVNANEKSTAVVAVSL